MRYPVPDTVIFCGVFKFLNAKHVSLGDWCVDAWIIDAGQKEDKAGQSFPDTAVIEVRGTTLKYVSRGGLKLEKAMQNFDVTLEGKICMDVGSSTGGFTDCMLQNGAIKVYAVDVGHGQLDWKLRNDERVVCMEKTNMRYVKPEDIGGTRLGSLGIPEFGTEFVMQMLKDTNPKCFSDLVRISGLSHGTDVWLGNAQTLIEEGKAEISTAICCRDDIMTYLINMGLDKEQSFTIMESVRKGKGLKPEWEEEMTSHGVPDWYIWSCKKIKYMFPKAHAAAYVMMGWRVAWFKVHKPLAYYAAYFGIRASAFSYEIMCRGKERLDIALTELLKTPKDQQTKKDQDTIRDGRIAQEMYARGFEFMPIDIYKAKARECQIIDGKIMPPLSSVEGLGDKACEQVEEAAKHGPFTSLENFRNQAKVSKTNVDKMVELGILTGLPETDQLTFDFFMAQSQV